MSSPSNPSQNPFTSAMSSWGSTSNSRKPSSGRAMGERSHRVTIAPRRMGELMRVEMEGDR